MPSTVSEKETHYMPLARGTLHYLVFQMKTKIAKMRLKSDHISRFKSGLEIVHYAAIKDGTTTLILWNPL